MNLVIQEDLEWICKQPVPWDSFREKSVLITGANGFLPSYLVRTLLFLNERYPDFNVKVHGLVRNLEKAKKRFPNYADREDFDFLVQDVSTPTQLVDSLDFIIHAASQASPKYFGKDPVGTLKANILGTYNMLELAREKDVEGFLFFSSGEVYGTAEERALPIPETYMGRVDPLNVRSCYAESKRMGENMCVSWYHQFQVPTKIIRPFHTYGPGLDLNDKRVFADFVANAVRGEDIVMKSDGSATRAFCYIADFTWGVFKVLLEGKAAEAYNLGSGKETSILDLAETIVGLVPGKNVAVDRKKEDRKEKEYFKSKISRSFPDISKARALGWSPKFDIREGFDRTIRSFLE